MTEVDEDALLTYFKELDADGSGELDKEEVKEALRNANKFGGEAQLEQLFQAADADENGTVNFEEFKLLMALPDKEDPLALVRCFVAEFIGVMLFQFFGGLADAGAAGNGIVLVVLIYCTAAVSGGHLNPAVTLALAITRQIPPLKMIIYWIAQFTGGIVGAACYWGLKPWQIKGAWSNDGSPGYLSCTLPCGGTGMFGGTEVTDDPTYLSKCGFNGGHIFGIEFLATFLLVFTVFGTAVDPKSGAGNFAPIAIGFSLLCAATCIGPYTGAGLNPARTLSPAIVFDCWTLGDFGDTFQWVYVLAQFAGGAAAGLVYMMVFLNRPDDGSAKAASNAFRFVSTETKALKQRLASERKNA